MVKFEEKEFENFEKCIDYIFEIKQISNDFESCAYFFNGPAYGLALFESTTNDTKFAKASDMKKIAKEQFENYGEVVFEAISDISGVITIKITQV